MRVQMPEPIVPPGPLPPPPPPLDDPDGVPPVPVELPPPGQQDPDSYPPPAPMRMWSADRDAWSARSPHRVPAASQTRRRMCVMARPGPGSLSST